MTITTPIPDEHTHEQDRQVVVSPITPRSRGIAVLSTALVLSVAYLLFVLHYSVNVLSWDEWNDIPIIHAALHSRLTLGDLWTQHNENRLLFPNLVIVASALARDYNSKLIIFFSALIFIASYGFLLLAFREYLGRPLTLLHSLSLGLIWFSLEDTENSLWAFQFAWYLIIFCLAIMLVALGHRRRRPNLAFVIAIIVSVIASYSSLQGLLLWPIGVIFLTWNRSRNRQLFIRLLTWIGAAIVTSGFYFLGFNFHATGDSPVFALHHPVGMAKFFFAAIGNVIPPTSMSLADHELLGCALFVIALVVVTRSTRTRTNQGRTPLTLALITFAIFFDVSIVFARINDGIGASLAPRYTMANLLLLLAIVMDAWTCIPRPRTRHLGRFYSRALGSLVLVLLAGFLVVQIVTATDYGFESARTSHYDRVLGARAVVNLDRTPRSTAQSIISAYVYPNLAVLQIFVSEAERDHLSEFAPGPYRFYRAKGPPRP